MNTPWGESQDVRRVASGVLWVSTASHGGYYVDSVAREQIPHEWRTRDGWYEEDCEALIPLAFVDDMNTDRGERSRESFLEALRAWFPRGGLREIRAPRGCERTLGVGYAWGLANA